LRNLRWLRFTLLAAALAGAVPAVAQVPDVPPGKWWKRPRLVEALHLTPDQQQRLEEIFARSRRGFVDLKAEVERRQIDVEELMAKKDSDAKKVASAIDALDQAKLRLGKARTMMIVEMRQILTAEQWQTILERLGEWRHERMDDRRQRRQGRGAGGAGGPGGPPAREPAE
jgi:Spy/CpxP family protein refolding chaperone